MTSRSRRRSRRSRSNGAPKRSTRRWPARPTISSSRSSAGGNIADVAKSAGAEVKTATDVHRAEQASLPEPVVAAIFREPADGEGSAATPDGRVVFKITADRTPPVDFADARVKANGHANSTPRPATACSINMSARCAATLGVAVHQDVLQVRRGQLIADDHPARLRSLRARLCRRRGRGRGHDAGRRSRDAGLGLSQARARPRRQHVPARIGRGRRAARPLFDDRPRSRPHLPLDRRSPPRSTAGRSSIPTPSSPAPAIRSMRCVRCSRNRASPCRPACRRCRPAIFGYLGYDMVRRMERLAPPSPTRSACPTRC